MISTQNLPPRQTLSAACNRFSNGSSRSTASLPTHSTPETQTQLRDWLDQARRYPPGSPQRNRYLTKIIRCIAPRLWRAHTPYYADALQKTWEYFVKRICTTYDPDRASIATWLNVYLRYRHQDLVEEAQQEAQRLISIEADRVDLDHLPYQSLGQIPSRDYGSIELLERLRHWAATDPKGILQRTCLQKRPDINGQRLILLRLPPEQSWREISALFNVRVSTLSSFYQRKCLPLLRAFAETD